MIALASFLACVATILLAMKADDVERGKILPCTVAMGLGWLSFQWGWLFYSPSRLAWMATGSNIDPVYFWAAADAMCGFYMFSKAYDRGWGFLIFMMFVAQELVHAIYEAGVVAFPAYSHVLDLTFGLQIACLFVGGRSGYLPWIGRLDDGWRLVSRRRRRAAAVFSQEVVK